MRQHNPATLDLIDPNPHQHSAMRTIDRWFAGNGEPQVGLVTRIDCFLKGDEAPAHRVCTANGEVPFRTIAAFVGDHRPID